MNDNLLISSIFSLIDNIQNEGRENFSEQISLIKEELRRRNSVLVAQFDKIIRQL